MVTIQSIVHQTLRLSSSLEEVRSNLDGRLRSLALAHDVLTHENWQGASLGEVVAGALQRFRTGEGTRISMSGPHIRLNPRAALAFSMALHELATNALKYGALSTESGQVIVNWDCDGIPADALWLRWEEHNGPPVKAPTRTGFGSRMIERMLVGEIGGQAKVDYRPRGIVCRIEARSPAFAAPRRRSLSDGADSGFQQPGARQRETWAAGNFRHAVVCG